MKVVKEAPDILQAQDEAFAEAINEWWDVCTSDDVEELPEQTETTFISKKDEEENGKACEVYRIPGFVEELTNYTIRRAHCPNWNLSFWGSMSLLGHVASRRYSFGDVHPNLIVFATGETGSGKESPRATIRNVLNASGISTYMTAKIASPEALENCFVHSPSFLFALDEIGTFLKAMGSEFVRNERSNAICERILEIFSNASSQFMTRALSRQKPTIVKNPSLSIFGTCTPGELYKAMNDRLLTNGLASRAFFVEASLMVGSVMFPSTEDVPKSVLNFIKKFNKASETIDGDASSLESLAMDSEIVDLQPDIDAMDVLVDKLKVVDALKASTEGAVRSVYARSFEKIKKISLLYALSVGDDHISKEAVLKAIEIVEYNDSLMLNSIRFKIHENEFQRNCNRVMDFLGGCRDKQATTSNLLVKFRGIKAKEMDEIVGELIIRKFVKQVTVKTKGRSANFYRLVV